MDTESRAGNTAELLRIEGLKKYFDINKGFLSGKAKGQVKAVDGIDLTLHPGLTNSLVGESGCGKTTVARLVLLLETPTEGRLLFEGCDAAQFRGNSLRTYRASVQAVFQDPNSSLNPRMKIKRIVSEPLIKNCALTSKQVSERVGESLRDVGLGSRTAELYPHELSGGQKQRVAMARALVLKPRLVVLDEPVSALDVSIGAQVMNLLRSLQQKFGVAYLLIAHNLATVRFLSDFVSIMYLGKIVESGPSEEVFAHPQHPYTRSLLAAALPAHPRRQSRGISLKGEVPSATRIPEGCRFHPRCPRVMPVCNKEQPVFKEISDGHRVACHLY